MIRCIVYIIYVILFFAVILNNNYDSLYYKIDFNSFISSALTILSIFFSFLLLLADNLTNKSNIENMNSVNGEYFLKNILLENKIKIYFSYFIFLINIIMLFILSFFSDTKNINIYFIKIVLLITIFSFIHAFFIINNIIENNKNNISSDIEKKKKNEIDQIRKGN